MKAPRWTGVTVVARPYDLGVGCLMTERDDVKRFVRAVRSNDPFCSGLLGRSR